MDRLFSIRSFDQDLLSRFSERCVGLITGRSPVLFTASLTSSYLRQNVDKEAEKDWLVIEHTGRVFDAGRIVTIDDVEKLFERSKDVDRAFLRNLVLPSVCIAIRYDDIAMVRKRRILFLARLVEDLLRTWDGTLTFPMAVRNRFTREHFRGILSEFLELYCVETQQLANSVKFLPPFNRAMDLFLDELVESMNEARRNVSAAAADRLFASGEQGSAAPLTGQTHIL